MTKWNSSCSFSALDVASGALVSGGGEVRFLQTGEKQLLVMDQLARKIKSVLMDRWGVNKIFRTFPNVVSRIRKEEDSAGSLEYWHSHVDLHTYEVIQKSIY